MRRMKGLEIPSVAIPNYIKFVPTKNDLLLTYRSVTAALCRTTGSAINWSPMVVLYFPSKIYLPYKIIDHLHDFFHRLLCFPRILHLLHDIALPPPSTNVQKEDAADRPKQKKCWAFILQGDY